MKLVHALFFGLVFISPFPDGNTSRVKHEDVKYLRSNFALRIKRSDVTKELSSDVTTELSSDVTTELSSDVTTKLSSDVTTRLSSDATTQSTTFKSQKVEETIIPTEAQPTTLVSSPATSSPTTAPVEEVTEITTEGTTPEEPQFIDILGDDSTTQPALSTPGSMETTTTMPLETRRERLSDQIRAVIKHYKDYGTVTVPDASVPDPMIMPTMKKTFSGNDMIFTNTKVYGLSNFTIEHINTDLDKMQVYVAIYIKRMVILGNYTAKLFFRKVSGPFNVTLLYVEANGAAELVKDELGNLQASESEMDMTFMDSKVRFGNMGIMGTLLQGMAASAGPVLFEAIKPIVLQEINQKVREDLNKKIKKIGSKFLESGTKPPVDVALEEARNYVRENGYDPYIVNNYKFKYMPANQSLIQVQITRMALTGLSNFRRVGEVSLSMDSGTVQMGLHLATSKLRGNCSWTFNIGQFKRRGVTNFTVDYVQGRGYVNQSLDVSKHPVLQDLDINVGKVRMKMKGAGPFDIVVEALVNTLPDLIRHLIVDAIELPLKYGLQALLSEIDVEDILEKKLPELDQMGL